MHGKVPQYNNKRISLPISLGFEVVLTASSRWYSKLLAEEGDWKSTLLGGALTDSPRSRSALACFSFSVRVRSYALISIHDASLVMQRHACVNSGLTPASRHLMDLTTSFQPAHVPSKLSSDASAPLPPREPSTGRSPIGRALACLFSVLPCCASDKPKYK